MGKIAIIVVVGFAVIVGVLSTSLTRRTKDGQNNNSSFYEKAQARNVAKSAASLYSRELTKNPNLDGTFSINIMGGKASIVLTEKVTGKRDKLVMTTNATYGNATTTILGDATDESENLPSVTGAVGISFLSKAKLKMGKNTYIDGNNYDLSGNKSNAFPAIAGISLGHPEQLTGLEYELKDVKIKGKGVVEPNIETQLPQKDYYDWAMQLATGADATYDGQKFTATTVFGTASNPQVTYVKGKTTFNANLSGHGVLIVEGNVKFNSTVNWTGMIFCVADSMESEKASFGGKGSQILGALMVAGKKASVKLGDIDILYSREAINTSYSLAKSRIPRSYSFSNWRE